MSKITKVMKFELRYLEGFSDFYQMQENLWKLQKNTREILNKTIQEAYSWDYRNRKQYLESGAYLDVLSETGYKRLDGYIYNSLKDDYKEMAAANLNATLQKGWKKYKSCQREILKGTISLPSYKGNQPLIIYKKGIRLTGDIKCPVIELTLFSKEFKQREDVTGNLRFEVKLCDNTQKAIFERVLSGIYECGESQLVYYKKKWFLLLTYIFTPEQHVLDPEKILGVDLGETVAIYASSINEFGSLKIEGGEVTSFAQGLERRRKSLQKQARYCGEGRVGHGTKTRVNAVYKEEDRIANFRNTINHRYSKMLIEYAVKNGYGTIQMENLEGIKDDTGFPKKLQHWTYYDLQNKIKAKAAEHGINVVMVKPQYTSQRCSKCGHISRENRRSQEQFCCEKCGYKCNAYFNASQNISIKNIESIIAEAMSAKS